MFIHSVTWFDLLCYTSDIEKEKEKAVIDSEEEMQELLEEPVVEEFIEQVSPLCTPQRRVPLSKGSQNSASRSTVDRGMKNDMSLQTFRRPVEPVMKEGLYQHSPSPMTDYPRNVSVWGYILFKKMKVSCFLQFCFTMHRVCWKTILYFSCLICTFKTLWRTLTALPLPTTFPMKLFLGSNVNLFFSFTPGYIFWSTQQLQRTGTDTM